ncbi:hypothetical protein V1264_012326 [Littorina saxatilis]|uniref:Uncharacterized protein n=1 Tax=Littorina saxatilis TaxID=31220 RepID=A0AAN9GLU6_9CAEN
METIHVTLAMDVAVSDVDRMTLQRAILQLLTVNCTMGNHDAFKVGMSLKKGTDGAGKEVTIVILEVTTSVADKVSVNEVKDVLQNAPADALPYVVHKGHVIEAAAQKAWLDEHKDVVIGVVFAVVGSIIIIIIVVVAFRKRVYHHVKRQSKAGVSNEVIINSFEMTALANNVRPESPPRGEEILGVHQPATFTNLSYDEEEITVSTNGVNQPVSTNGK